ncbi:hypothetical protein MKW94_000995, partial [Papaver nudicaule]|nr:hypothetical protein [Papaver nudicaule]
MLLGEKELEEFIKEATQSEAAIKKITDEARPRKLALDEEYKKKAREDEKMSAVKQKYNALRKALYAERKEHIQSIPDFWPTAILNLSRLRKYLRKEDEEIIKVLKSVAVQDVPNDKSGRIIAFFFGENQYFENTCLRTMYAHTDKGIVHKLGTKILWKKGTDATTGSETETPVKKGSICSLTDIKKSFFTRLFEPKRKDIPLKVYNKMRKAIEESLWPRALGYFLYWSGISAMEVERSEREIALNALKIIHDKLEKMESEEFHESITVEQEFGEKARKLQVLIEQTCNQGRRPLYQKRNEIVKRFPNFWLLAFLSHYALGDLFSEEDQKIFRFVSSVDVEDDENVVSGYTITLNLSIDNPYFKNSSLTKRISFCEDGTTNLSAVDIDWNVDMDIATEYQHDTSVTNTSFFTWFCAPQVIRKGYHDEVSELIKGDLWPNAVEYFVNMKKEKLHDELLDLPKSELKASPVGLISSLPDQPSSKRCKLEEHAVLASSGVASSTSVVPKDRIHLVKDSIESRQFIKALQLITVLQSEFPPSALVLALKALVYEKFIGESEVLSICSDAKDHMFSDISGLPDVLATLDTVCQRLNRLDMATSYYEHACGEDCDSLELMRGLFNCYARQSSFAKQLKVSLRMYKLVREDKFLFWAVFCIQLQVLCHLLKKHGMGHNLDEPEAFLIYMSITELQEMYDPVREILYKLGSTLLVVKADKEHLEGGKLLAHVCDYAAAVEVFKKILESCSPGDWESLLNDIGCALDDDSKWCVGGTENKIQPPVFLACKISQLPSEKCGSKILEALKLSNLENGRNRCHPDRKDNDLFEEAIYEYFTRIDHMSQRFFRILSKDEEYGLIDNLLKQDVLTTELLKEEFSKICTVSKIPKHFETLCEGPEGFKSAIRGATIVLKTNKFIILAADGKLTSAYSDNALYLKSEKIRQFDDLCFAISGVWNTLSKTVGIVNKYMRHFKKNGEGRPTVRKLAGCIAKEDPMSNGACEVIICAFDELEVGQPPVACVSSFPGIFACWNNKKSFCCSGRYSGHAEYILKEGNVHTDMGLAEAICWVERALVYTAMFDSCTGGLAN